MPPLLGYLSSFEKIYIFNYIIKIIFVKRERKKYADKISFVG